MCSHTQVSDCKIIVQTFEIAVNDNVDLDKMELSGHMVTINFIHSLKRHELENKMNKREI